MSMRKVFCILLAIGLLAGTASAEGLRVYDGYFSDDTYKQTYPDRELVQFHSDYDDAGRCDIQERLLQDPTGWDVAVIGTEQCDVAVLDQAGLLMDLSGDSFTSQEVGRMYAPIQGAVTREGRLLGMPTLLFGLVMETQMGRIVFNSRTKEYVDIAEKLGFTEADYPSTFDELCLLAQRYMDLSKAERKGTVFHIDAAASNAKNYFLYYLISIYTAEYCDETGHVEYDTPEFRGSLESLEAMAKALKSQPTVTYGEGASVYGLVSDGGTSLLSRSPSQHLHIGNSTAIPARLYMVVVNSNTPRKNEALDYITCAVAAKDSDRDVKLLDGVDYETLALALYDDLIADAYIELETRYQKGDKNHDIMQESIAGMLQDRESGDYIHFYPKEAVENYVQNVVPHLTFPRVPQMDMYAIAKEYVRGKLDADGLIAKLNAIADENVAPDAGTGER